MFHTHKLGRFNIIKLITLHKALFDSILFNSNEIPNKMSMTFFRNTEQVQLKIV